MRYAEMFKGGFEVEYTDNSEAVARLWKMLESIEI